MWFSFNMNMYVCLSFTICNSVLISCIKMWKIL